MNSAYTLAMACAATSKKTVFWLVVGLISNTRAQPVTTALKEGVEVAAAPEEHLQDLAALVVGADHSQTLGHIKNIANSLDQVFRQGRQLQDQVAGMAGRQTAATLATSLGSLIRPAITAFVGALSMNSATSITNAITALLGGRSLDVIPAETFMTAPVGRESSVVQPTRESAEEGMKRRPLRRKQRHPASTTYPYSRAL